MSESDRRKFLRVLFESSFEVRSTEWSDKEATGLDISLNGCRFNCKRSMSDGELVSIVFKPDLELEGSIRWCWPIEWYFQGALNFEDITQEKQAKLKAYIEEVTGEVYQLQTDNETTPGATLESVEILEEDLDDIDIGDDLSSMIIDVEDKEEVLENSSDEGEMDELPPLEEEDLLNLDIEEPIEIGSDFSKIKHDNEFLNELDEGDINTQNSAGKKIVLYDMDKDQAELLNHYLSDRAGMDVEFFTKKENLWRMLKIDPMDFVIFETGVGVDSDALELMQQTKDQFPNVKFICISGPVSLERRLQFLNAGALDYLIRPVHLSTIAQSILVNLSQTVGDDFKQDFTRQEDKIATNKNLQEELALMKLQRDEAIADAKVNAKKRDQTIAESKDPELRAEDPADEKESLYLDENFILDVDAISDSTAIDPIEDLSGAASLLDEDLKVSAEVDLIEEDY